MRCLSLVGRLIARVRVAPSPVRAGGVRAQTRQPAKVPKGPVVPPPPPRPALAPTRSRFVQIEREVLERFRPQLRQAVQDALDAVAAGQTQADTPVCCGKAMHRHDRCRARWLTWVGSVQPTGSLDLRAMLRDTLASLDELPETRQQVRARLPATATPRILTLEKTIRAGLDLSEAYNDVPGRETPIHVKHPK